MTSVCLIAPRSPIFRIVNPSEVGTCPEQTQVFGVQRLPTDPVGTATVTFSGVVAGSEIRVYNPTGEVAGIESCVANQVLTWPVYAAGSPNNNVQIKIIHTVYSIMDFPYPSAIGSQSIPVQQEPDKWYLNPA